MFHVLIHPKPMLRHSTPVMPAIARATVVLPGPPAPGQRKPGIYLDINHDSRGAHQLLVIPEDQLNELRVALAAFSTDKE